MTARGMKGIDALLLHNYRARPTSGRWERVDTEAEIMEYKSKSGDVWLVKVEFGKVYVYKLSHTYSLVELKRCSDQSSPVQSYNYSELDWTKSDLELAKMVGVTRQRIYQVRRHRESRSDQTKNGSSSGRNDGRVDVH